MRKWLLIILGVVGVAVVAVLGLSWYALNKPVDLNSATGRGYAEGFKKQFHDSCMNNMEKMKGETLDEATQAKFDAFCICQADAMFEEYKDDPPAKMLTLGTDAGERDTMNRIMTTCAQQAGLQ